MDFKSQLGPNALTITYPHTADGRKPSRPNMLTLMSALDDNINRLFADNINSNRKINRLQWSIGSLAVLNLILYWI